MNEPLPSPSRRSRPVDEASLRAGIRQTWGWAIMFGAGELSFGLFAAELKMSTLFFGLLAGVPPLLGPLVQVLAANCLDRYGHRKRLVLIGALIQVACFVPLACLAFLVARQVPVAIGTCIPVLFLLIVCLYFAGGSFTNPPYSSMIGELVPEQRRGDYFARVSRDACLLVLLSQALVGGALKWAEWHGGGAQAVVQNEPAEPGGGGVPLALFIFAGSFVIAGAARFHSYTRIRVIQDPPYEPRADAFFTFVQFIRRTRESNFVKFVLFIALTHFSAQVAGPYFLPYWKYELGYDTSQWVVLSGAATLASILTLPWWGRFSSRFGNKRTLMLCSVAIGAVPLWWMISTHFYYLVAVNLVSGIVWSGFNLASWNYILEAVTPHKRARCVAYFNIVCGAGMFSGAMLGDWLHRVLPAHQIQPGLATPFFYLLLISGVCRLLTCFLLLPLFRELREVQSLSAHQWIFRMTRIRFPVGVRFDAQPLDEEDGPPETSTPAPGQPTGEQASAVPPNEEKAGERADSPPDAGR